MMICYAIRTFVIFAATRAGSGKNMDIPVSYEGYGNDPPTTNDSPAIATGIIEFFRIFFIEVTFKKLIL
jgi:hypothetical protein